MSQEQPDRARPLWPLIALIFVALLWAGMVLGISFLETPVKFTAPSLKQAVPWETGRAVALDIGRVVFGAFNKVEIFWSVLSFGLLFFARPFQRVPRAIGVLWGLLWAIVAFQSIVLVPALAERAQMVLRNETLPPAPYHALYSGSELIKFAALIALGVLLVRRCAERKP